MRFRLPKHPCMANHTCDKNFLFYTVVLDPCDLLLKKIFLYGFAALFCLMPSFSSKAQDMLAGLTSNGGPEGKGTLFNIKTNGTGFTVVKGFADWGKNPLSNLVQGPDGNYYGMTFNGGTFSNYGTI